MGRGRDIERDADAILQLAGHDAPPLSQLGRRRQQFLAALGSGADADVWMWTLQQLESETLATAYLGLIEKGWARRTQRAGWLDGTFSPEFEQLLDPVRSRLREHFTVTRSDLLQDEDWYESDFYRLYRAPYGLDDFLLSFRPVGPNLQSVVRLHRFKGRPAFSELDRELVHRVTGKCEWLHDVPLPQSQIPSVKGLSPRERQVLISLLQGGSAKEIAEELSLSVHTVNDYMRELHRHFGAQSRSEIMARFIPRTLLTGAED